jgi:hypothetical protein
LGDELVAKGSVKLAWAPSELFGLRRSRVSFNLFGLPRSSVGFVGLVWASSELSWLRRIWVGSVGVACKGCTEAEPLFLFNNSTGTVNNTTGAVSGMLTRMDRPLHSVQRGGGLTAYGEQHLLGAQQVDDQCLLLCAVSTVVAKAYCSFFNSIRECGLFESETYDVNGNPVHTYAIPTMKTPSPSTMTSTTKKP